MSDVLIFVGLGVNIVGAIFLMAYAVKYTYAFHKSKNSPIQTEALKPGWQKKRAIGWGLIILGILLAFVGCII